MDGCLSFVVAGVYARIRIHDPVSRRSKSRSLPLAAAASLTDNPFYEPETAHFLGPSPGVQLACMMWYGCSWLVYPVAIRTQYGRAVAVLPRVAAQLRLPLSRFMLAFSDVGPRPTVFLIHCTPPPPPFFQSPASWHGAWAPNVASHLPHAPDRQRLGCAPRSGVTVAAALRQQRQWAALQLVGAAVPAAALLPRRQRRPRGGAHAVLRRAVVRVAEPVVAGLLPRGRRVAARGETPHGVTSEILCRARSTQCHVCWGGRLAVRSFFA